MADPMIDPSDLEDMRDAMEESFDFTGRMVIPSLSNDPRNPSGGSPSFGPDFRCRVIAGLLGKEQLYAARIVGKQAYTVLVPVGTANVSTANKIQIHDMDDRIFNILGIQSGQTWEVVTQISVSE